MDFSKIFINDPIFFIVEKLTPLKAGLYALFLSFIVTFILALWDKVAFSKEKLICYLKDPMVYWYKLFMVPLGAFLAVSIYNESLKFEEIKVSSLIVKTATSPLFWKIDLTTLASISVSILILIPTIKRLINPVDVSEKWYLFWWSWSKPLRLSALWNNFVIYPLLFYFTSQVCFRIFLSSLSINSFFENIGFIENFSFIENIGHFLFKGYFFLFLVGLSIPINVIFFQAIYKKPLLKTPLVIFLILIYLAISFYTFFFPLMKIHNLMLKTKESKIQELNQILRNQYLKITRNNIISEKDALKEGIKLLSAYIVLNRVEKMKTWPIDVKKFLSSLFMIIIPCILNITSLFEISIKIFNKFWKV